MIDEKQQLESQFLTAEKFYREVNEIVWKDDVEYLEAIMAVCDNKSIDPEDLVRLKLISPILKSKLEEEGIAGGLLKPSSKLPI